MYTAATHRILEVKGNKLGKLYIRMRNCKTSKMVEGQSVDYAAIHAAKRGLSQYPPGVYTPPKSGRGPPCGEVVTVDGEFPYNGR
jgi:hypothetical protein